MLLRSRCSSSSSLLAGSSTRSRCRAQRKQQLRVRAQAPLTGNTGGGVSSNAASGPPLSFERPSGGGSRSFDLPRSSDAVWAPRSDLLRPSGGASRGAAFFAAASGEGPGSSIDRPGGRGGRDDLPKGWDIPSAPVDPAYARPGGRGGRDVELDTSGGSGGPSAPVNIDRPGGRGGRGDLGGGGGDSGGSGGSGGSSGGGGDGGSGGGGGAGKAVGSVALYAGVIAAAWFGHKAFFADKPAEAPPAKSCCSGKKGSSKK